MDARRHDRTNVRLRRVLQRCDRQVQQALLALHQASEAVLLHAATLSIERLTIIMGHLNDARTALQSAPDPGGSR